MNKELEAFEELIKEYFGEDYELHKLSSWTKDRINLVKQTLSNQVDVEEVLDKLIESKTHKHGSFYTTLYELKELKKQLITKPTKSLDTMREEIIAPYGRDLFTIKYGQLNLMISNALKGLNNDYNKYCGIRKRTTKEDKIKAYDYILDDIIKKKKQIMDFDLKYHTYCLESAQEYMVLQEIIKLCKSGEWVKGITLKERILDIVENIEYFGELMKVRSE